VAQIIKRNKVILFFLKLLLFLKLLNGGKWR